MQTNKFLNLFCLFIIKMSSLSDFCHENNKNGLRFCGKVRTYPSPKPHFALSEKVVLMLSKGRVRWSEKKKKRRFESLPLIGYSRPIRMRISIVKYGILVALIGAVLPM